MADIPGEKELRDARRRVTDFANALDRASTKSTSFQGALEAGVKSSEDLANQIDKLASKVERTAAESEKLKKLTIEFDKASNSANILYGVLKNKLSNAFDQLGKKIVKTWTNLANNGLDKLEAGIKRVYLLYEKWTRALGEFRTRMGAASGTMGAALKFAKQWEGTMHGLTGQFGQGIPMVAEFAEGIQRALKDSDKTLVFFGLKVGRTFGLASDQVGQMVRSFENFGASVGDQKKIWGTIADQSDKAQLNLGAFSQELVQSREFMVRFGKQGAKTFVESAAYVRKLGISIKSLEGFYDLTDTFEGATKAASRLNTVFGTTINSLGLMLEQNPAKRFDMVRTQLLQQGKDIKNLMPQEIKLISETIGLTTDETNAMLKSGQTFDQYQKQKAKSIDVEKRVHEAMNKTALTMFSFSQAADKITTAIANAIRPFLKLIGLAGQGDKDFKSFGQVMGTITNKIVDFFNGLGKNKAFQEFLQKAAGGVKMVAQWIGKQLAPAQIQKTIDKIVNLFKTAWDWSKKIMAVWVGFKVFQGFGGLAGGISKIVELKNQLGGLRGQVAGGGTGEGWMGAAMNPGVMQPNSQGKLGRSLSFLRGGQSPLRGGIGGGLAGAAAGMVGVMSGQMSISQGVGTAIGSALGGAIAGPVGAAFGGWLGKKGGQIIGELIDGIRDAKSFALKRENEKLDAQEKEIAERKKKSLEQIHAEEAAKQVTDFEKQLGALNQQKGLLSHTMGTDPKKLAIIDKQIAAVAKNLDDANKKKKDADFDLFQITQNETIQRKKHLDEMEALDDLEKLRGTDDFKRAMEAAKSGGVNATEADALKVLMGQSGSKYSQDAKRIASVLYPTTGGRQPVTVGSGQPSGAGTTNYATSKSAVPGKGTTTTHTVSSDIRMNKHVVGRALTTIVTDTR